ncbi:MAG: c-type cytochrome [Pseudomonadota bacterium]
MGPRKPLHKFTKSTLIALVLLASGALGFIASWFHYRQATIVTMQTVHYPTLFVSQLQGDPHAGEKIFKEFCASCHVSDPIINVKAPAIGDEKAWKFRRQLGMNTLLKITINGVGAMPARGGCFECSDEQLRVTIAYMLSGGK